MNIQDKTETGSQPQEMNICYQSGGITLSEISKTEKSKYRYDLTYMWNLSERDKYWYDLAYMWDLKENKTRN